MHPRIVPFSSVSNFRDLGGYCALGGRVVRWQRLYRSDTLSRLAEADWERFAALGIRTVLDLRRPEEIARDGRIPQFDGIEYRNVHLRHRKWKPYIGEPEQTRYLADRYRDLTEEAAADIAEALGLVAREDAAPLVMHCLAGKDRTGVLSALILGLLGVTDDDIADDFALSSAPCSFVDSPTRRVPAPEIADVVRAVGRATVPGALPLPGPPAPAVPLPGAVPLPDGAVPPRGNMGRAPVHTYQQMPSPREAILVFLRELRTRYGSVDGYVTAIGVTPTAVSDLRKHLLR